MKTQNALFAFLTTAVSLAIGLTNNTAEASNGECFIVRVVESVTIAQGQIIELTPAPIQQAESAYFRVTEFVSGYLSFAIATTRDRIRYCPDKGTILVDGKLFRVEPE